MIHSFSTDDAGKYGLVEAVMLNNFRYWIGHNAANGRHHHDGRTWTYNSVKAFGALFPYLSDNQIRRSLESLIDQGILVRGNYNESAYDKTSWFAFSDAYFQQIDLANLPNGGVKSATSHTNSKHTIKTKTNTQCVFPDDFSPNETCVELSEKLGVNASDEVQAFKDHHTSKESKFSDWQAAFRTWIRNAAKYAQRDTRGQRGSASRSPGRHSGFGNMNYKKGIEDDGSFI